MKKAKDVDEYIANAPEEVRGMGKLEKYRTSKETASFPLDKSLPIGLIKKLLK